MKRKIIAAIVAAALTLNVVLPTITANAEPVNKEVQAAQDQYAEMQANIAKITEKINSYNSQIEPLVVNVQNNKQEISDLQKQMENTQQEIEQAKEKISKQEEVLGNRLSDMYKSGGEFSYVNLIFGANNFGDLINRIEVATRIITTDKNIVETLKNDKENLDNQVKSLQEKTKKVEDLKTKNEKELENLQNLKSEQEVIGQQANEAQKEFDKKYLSRYEKEIVSGQLSVLNNNSSSISDLKSAISQITDLNNSQIKSPIVKQEIQDAIANGKRLISQKEAQARAEQEAQARAEQEANRGSNGNSTSNSSGSSNNVAPPSANKATAQAVLNEAYKHLGKPYVWGATGPNSFDCSGFTSYVYKKVTGRWIGRTTYDQINVGTPVSRSQLQPGDLVFTSAGHVGIYVGNNNFINAPRTGSNVSVMPLWSFYAARRIL
ncbi:NlpC/P60 family protein [Clostridium thermobutyricum]|uniref:Putative endopeptidase n=1 Tax=Clostridium thermobutyricum DSM 4928 TaxID=1121339 RepID=A0A1V4SXP9_9CLOT|nr:C40 family peptidase [Clostridium thermobutyricum]OPX49361.1 putative endopeptidase precursor [Clostridium thermobutyricum DSM 4928]